MGGRKPLSDVINRKTLIDSAMSAYAGSHVWPPILVRVSSLKSPFLSFLRACWLDDRLLGSSRVLSQERCEGGSDIGGRGDEKIRGYSSVL